MAEYVMEYDGWAEGIPVGEYLKVRDAMHARKREEVVRCRDCKHSSVSFDETRTTCRYWSMNDYDDSESSHGYTLYPVVQPDGFCAWGKRKEGE